MDTLRKTTAVFSAILFVFTGVTALLLFNFDRSAFTAETYQKAFAREDLYNKLPAVMAEAMTTSGADQSRFPIVMQGMSREAWEAFFRSLLPPETLKPMGDEMLASAFAYLNGQADVVNLSLAPLKARMTSEAGTQAVLSLLGTLPACDLLQISQMSVSLLASGQIEFCSPPAELYPLLTPVIQGQLQAAASAIPEQMTLVSAPPQNDPRQKLQTIRLLMRLSLILPLTFLFALTVFAVRSLKDWLMWWGIPFTAAGAGAFLAGLLGAPVFKSALQRILMESMPDYLPVFLLDFASDFASAMVRALLDPVLWQGLTLAILGMGMAGAGYYLSIRKTNAG
ncbi:MAG: hypothetical protein DPW18_15290 [Chloroflexi bacterium]|nr:hypothetical protein [Chloroflexota bacterium]MDL1943365.1 hypothetical protein [Chloroflexi bacterium CFX2]